MTEAYMSRRDAAIAGLSGVRSGGRSRRLLGGAALALVVGAGAWLLLVSPDDTSTTVDTSQSANIQTPETATGVDTRLPLNRAGAPQTAAPGEAAMAPPVVTRADDAGSGADRARIAELERDLAALRAAQGDNADLEAALRGLRDEMQAQFDRERALAEEAYQLQLAEMARTLSSGDTGMSDGEREARQRLEEERQRRAAIAEAQIMSDGIVLDASGAKMGGGSHRGSGGSTGGGGAEPSNRQLSSNESFMAQAGAQGYETVRATRIAAPGRTIVQGTTLNAVLETAISTELPGVIRAVITDDVMSHDGMTLLLPKGSRLVGSYNSDVSVVQGRVQIAWNRVVTPEGTSVELGSYGADALGGSGQAGRVDARFGQRFGSAALISLMGAGPDVVIGRNSGTITTQTAEDIGDDLTTATQGVLADYLGAGPVIYIDQGTYMTVFVNRDLVF